MVEASLVLSAIQTIGILIGVIIALQPIRDIKETRQAELFMHLYGQWRDPDRLRLLAKSYEMEWKDYYDFQKKYSVKNMEERLPYSFLSYFYEGIGVLVKEGLTDIELVSRLMSGDLKGYWEKFGPFIMDHRRIGNYPDYFDDTEYLHREIQRIKGIDWEKDLRLGHQVNEDA